ncbi:hypothetical protein AMECASPLE_004245 [Ameca splendens]|uniref:Coiled-coil domain-containing protein 73 n=1 Tax=Ameca splendens TaxID=208324 RepID=A0ABV0Y9S2_9TELE
MHSDSVDPKTDSETAPFFSAFEHPAMEQELFPPSSHSQTEGGAPILLQLLEFKTHLQEIVEELHIRRDAQTRFEDEISKLVLEKQELEWEKESLQHQIETMAKQHAESLSTVKKMFQVRLQHMEEEKLLKYNLEKKSSELEQKLALQTRTKDNHLNQLAEVEKRFSALSKQCAMVKQAHDKLEKNVDEAMKINSKLTSACQKQEEIVLSHKKELEEVSNKLIKEKMKSVRHEKTQSPLRREQPVQELQQKLNMETEINKKLRQENVAERAEKKRLMRSLQHNQQLLLSQTQTVRRIEQELESQTVMFQALKQEHEVMLENRKAMEDKVAELTESYAASKTSWEKEKATILNQIKSEQSDLQAAKEAFEGLQQKCSELTLQVSCQAQQTEKREMKGNGQSPLVPTQLFFRALETPIDPNCSSELPDLDSLQHTVSSQAKFLDCLKDTGAASKLTATGASGDQDKSNHQQQMIKQISSLTSPDNFEKAAETSDLIGLGESYLSKSTCVSMSNPGCGSLNRSTELLDYETYEENNRGTNEKDQGGEDNQQDTNNMEQKRKEHVKRRRNAGEKRTIPVQTAERTDVHRGTKGSATEKTSNPETKDRGEGEVTDRVKERGQTAEHASGTPETQIPALMTADMTEASLTVQVSDFMDTELLSTVCEPLNSTECVYEKTTEKDGNLNNEFTASTEEHKVTSDEHQSISAEDVLHNLPAAVQTSCPESEPLMNNQSIPPCQIPGDENPPWESSGAFTAECSIILKQLRTCTSTTYPAVFAGEFQQNNNVQESQTNRTETERCNPSHVNTNVIQTNENTDAHVTKESELVREPPQEISAKASVQLTSAVANGEEDAQKRKESQPNVNTCETAHKASSTFSLGDVSMEAILLPDVSTGNIQEHANTNTLKDVGDKEISENRGDLKRSVLLSHDNNESSEIDCSQLHQKAPQKKRPNACFDLSLMSKNTSSSLFDWGTAQRKTFSSGPKSDGSVLQQLNQETDMSGPDTAGRPHNAMPMFIKSQHSKVPLHITRASDLFSATSVSGAAACLTSPQKESREVKEETCREEAAETRPSLSLSFFPVTPSSNTSSRGSCQNNPDCSKAPSPTSVPACESDWDPPCSEVRETQQSSLRAQISKIEQFLNSERLRLPKRHRTDN